MTEQPLVSLGIPVYNGENYLSECIECLLAQTFENFEIVISDNASTDGTQEICERYAAQDKRIRYDRCDHNLGAAPNFNRVFELSRAPYFKWVAHDDLVGKEFLEIALDIMKKDPGIVVCQADKILIDGNGEPLDEEATNAPITGQKLPVEPLHIGEQNWTFLRYNDVLNNCQGVFHLFGLIRREALKKTNMYYSIFGAERVLLTELALQGRFHRFEDKLFVKRFHPGMSEVQDNLDTFIDTKNGIHGTGLALLKLHLKTAWNEPGDPLTKIFCVGAVLAKVPRSRIIWKKVGKMAKRVVSLPFSGAASTRQNKTK